MKTARAAFLSTALLLTCLTSASAAARHAPSAARLDVVARTFSLHVIGSPDRRATFWVAYGPLQGRFGVVRLRRTRVPTIYAATVSLPARGRAIFAYLAGEGTVQSPAGDMPGDPVVTLARTGPLSLTRGDAPPVNWRVPIG